MEYSKEFEYFWKWYPARWHAEKHVFVKRRKFPAWQSWQKLDADTQKEILCKMKLIKASEGKYPRDAVTWLNQRGWDDIEDDSKWESVLPDELTDVFKTADKPNIIPVWKQRKALGL